MKIEKVMTVYKHYTGLWIVLALVRVNGIRITKRLSFDTEEEARAVQPGAVFKSDLITHNLKYGNKQTKRTCL